MESAKFDFDLRLAQNHLPQTASPKRLEFTILLFLRLGEG